jgi:PhoH-like ATPase
MPLPTLPSKLGDLLPADQYKARVRPTKNVKKSASADAIADTPASGGATVEYLPTAAAELAGTAVPAAIPRALRDPVRVAATTPAAVATPASSVRASDAGATATPARTAPDRGTRPPERKQRTAALPRQKRRRCRRPRQHR